jgi:chromosome segregation protein
MRSATAAEERLKRAFAALEAQMAATALGRLYVTGGAERAIDIALGPWRTEAAPVTPQLDDFVTWREQVRAHFPPGAAWADELVDSRDPVPAVLLGTVVVRDLGEAEALWETLATLEAHRIGSPAIQVATRDGGLVTAYGSRSHAEDDLGIRYLATRTELAHLAAERRRLSRNEARVGRLVSRLHELHDAHRSSLTAALRAADIEQQRNAKLQAELRVIEARRSRLEREIEERSRALSTVSGRCASVDAALREKLQVLNGLEREEAEARSVVPQAETAVAEVQTALAEARRQVEALASDRAILAKRAQAHEELAATAGVEVDRLRAEPARLESELLATEEELERLDGELRALQGQRGQLAAAAVECEKRLAEVRVDRPQSLQEGRELRRARDASDQALARHERAAARRDEVVAAGRRLEHEIQQEMEGAELYDVEMAPDDIPTEEEIRRLRARAAQYADYDPAILTEYAEMCERRRYLTSQIGDLKSTAEGLREIMTVADAEMRVRFASALGRVGDEFNRVFTGMLRGGEARLEQSEDGGVEVRASLPGKRTRSSASFSGGERALVASALLFGVLRIRPAPFCVLDEVDAALDETNVDRYLEALRDLSQRMQVLVVTHNRATMAAATALYGLTMDSDGASSLLSLRLDQYDAVS